jgi:hypothetical protein
VTRSKRLGWALVVLWAGLVSGGTIAVARYKGAPGEASSPGSQWPQGSSVKPNDGVANLVMMAHPKCACTRASLGELAKLMTDLRGKVLATVLVLKPDGTGADFAETDLVARAREIDGVRVVVDEGGREAERFKAKTSGDTIVYSPRGELLFHGGITLARGHMGDNAGRRRITELVRTQTSDKLDAPVFGCPLKESEKLSSR